MTASSTRRLPLARFGAGAFCITAFVATALSHPPTDAQPPGLLFFVIVLTCAGMVLMVRGLGQGIGAGVGVLVGLALAIVLTTDHLTSPVGRPAFFVISAGILGLLGHVAGTAWQPGAQRDLRDGDAAPRRTEAPIWLNEDGRPAAALALDFVRWRKNHELHGASAAECWAAFEAFVRQALRSALGARGVRLFRLVEDGTRLVSLTPATIEPPVTMTGPIWTTPLSTGRPAGGAAVGAAESRDGPLDAAALIPLRGRGQPSGLISIARFERPFARLEPQLQGVMTLLEALWSYWHVQYGDCTPAPGAPALLDRPELLARLARLHSAARAAAEPLTVIVLQIDGLDAFDSPGRWQERDELLARLAATLARRASSDDAVGRFRDDRLVLALPRKNHSVSMLIAAQLQATLQAVLAPPAPGSTRLGTDDHPPAGSPTLRLGVAAFTPGPPGHCACQTPAQAGNLTSDLTGGDAEQLLSCALRLAEEARRTGAGLCSAEVRAAPAPLVPCMGGRP